MPCVLHVGAWLSLEREHKHGLIQQKKKKVLEPDKKVVHRLSISEGYHFIFFVIFRSCSRFCALELLLVMLEGTIWHLGV